MRRDHGIDAQRQSGSAAAAGARPRPSGPRRLPYDARGRVRIRGRPGRAAASVINVDADGTFVADGDRLRPGRGSPPPAPLPDRGDGDRLPDTFRLGDIRPRRDYRPTRSSMASVPQPDNRSCSYECRRARAPGLDRVIAQAAHAAPCSSTWCRAAKSSFFFSIVDSNSGRELQDEPIHNLASLGKTNGERPFRVLPQPLSFAPRSTIRLQVIENSEGVRGTLFIVLYGYKILAASHCPESVVRALGARPNVRAKSSGCPPIASRLSITSRTCSSPTGQAD